MIRSLLNFLRADRVAAKAAARPLDAAQEARVRELVREGVNLATQHRNREAGERLRLETEAMQQRRLREAIPRE